MLDGADLAMIEELIRQRTGISASPGYIWSRSGNVPDGTYLQSEGNPSNLVGLPVQVTSGVIRVIFFDQEIPSSFDLVIFKHPSPFVEVARISIVNDNSGVIYLNAPFPIVNGADRLGCRVENGSAKSINAGCLIMGSIS